MIMKWLFNKFATLTMIIAVLIFAGEIASGSGNTNNNTSTETTEYVTDANGERISMARSSDSKSDSTKDKNGIGFNVMMTCDGYVIYDFAKDQYIGINGSDACTDFEAYEGIHTTVSDKNIIVKAYTHDLTYILKSSTAIIMDMKGNTKTSEIELYKNGGNNLKVCVGTYPNGLYKINNKMICMRSNDKTEYVFKGTQYIYVYNKTVYTCRAKVCDNSADADADATQNGMCECKTAWIAATNKIDKDDALNLNEITYPTNGDCGRVVETSKWAALSKKILSKYPDDISDATKVSMFIEYISYNIAFDQYRANVLMSNGNSNRAEEAGDMDHVDPANYTYENHVGVCWDYVNILAIMCRANGIPCTSVENDEHTFNAVYLNGHWYPFDITKTNMYQCNTKNTDKSKWIDQMSSGTNKHDHGTSSAGFGEYFEAPMIKTNSQQIWTYETGTAVSDD